MDEATQNAIAEATSRLDRATQTREGSVIDAPFPPERIHAALVAEATAWASLAVAAAISGSAPQMPSIADIMSQMTGGVQ